MLSDLTTCPACGAANAADARWCGQCYAPLYGGDAAAPGGDEPPSQPTAQSAEAEWTCARCDGVNPIDVGVCGHCGSEIYASFGDSEPVRLATVTVGSVLVPGMALSRVGRQLEGLTVGFLVLAAFGFAAVLRSRVAIAIVLVTYGIALWVLSVHDAQRIAAGDRGAVLLRAPVLKAVVFGSIAGLALLLLFVLSSVQDLS